MMGYGRSRDYRDCHFPQVMRIQRVGAQLCRNLI